MARKHMGAPQRGKRPMRTVVVLANGQQVGELSYRLTASKNEVDSAAYAAAIAKGWPVNAITLTYSPAFEAQGE